MNRPDRDREDAIARALDILPPGDPAASDPRLVRDAALAAEAQSTREAAADVWLAVSPLRAAPPEVLHSIMDKLGTPAAAERVRKPKLAPLLAASGWAAAAAVAILLWPRHEGERAVPIAGIPGPPPTKFTSRENPAGAASGAPEIAARDEKLRREYSKLQQTVDLLRRGDLLTAPRVMSLVAPGASKRSQEETRQRVMNVLTTALRSSLEVESGAPGDPASIVIERGWLPEGIDLTSEGAVLRHRNFPEDSWQELGLLRSDEGSYYDPTRHLLWTADGPGGSFLGRRADEETTDLSGFKPAAQLAAVDNNKVTRQPRTEPEGFVIEDPTTKKAEVVIDQVPPPAKGHEHKIVWTDDSGATGTIPVQSAASASISTGNGNSAVYFSNGGWGTLANPYGFNGIGNGQLYLNSDAFNPGFVNTTVMASFLTTSNVTSFQLIEIPIVVPGQATTASPRPRVIVQGGN
ncbi:hypothetical protein [Luteolibacter sp. Populi]|uniref:hypothetical protein n=1 Tax=Luteolibacter sp. Populi TaxID=3230487 RepID=UPI003465A7A1